MTITTIHRTIVQRLRLREWLAQKSAWIRPRLDPDYEEIPF